MSIRASQKMNTSIIIDMKNNLYPFGEYSNNDETRKIFVRKKITYRNANEKTVFEQKLKILKNICHKNVINLKSIEQIPSEGYVLYYNYVAEALQTAFDEIDQQTFKELHRQIIHLAIHLAKNYVLTSFNPNRCGVLFVQGKYLIKYYLPLNEIVITDNIAMLERSVQLFKVQAMHLLDTLRHHDVLTLHSSQTSLELNLKQATQKASSKKFSDIFQEGQEKTRKLSSPNKKSRKFSHFQENINRKKSQDSTTFSEQNISRLKKTLRTIRIQSQTKRQIYKSREKIKIRVDMVKIRSSKAIKLFKVLKKQICDYIALSRLLALCNQF